MAATPDARTETSVRPSLLEDRRIVIDADELEEARRDPRVIAFIEEAREFGDRLRREGRHF